MDLLHLLRGRGQGVETGGAFLVTYWFINDHKAGFGVRFGPFGPIGPIGPIEII